MDTTKISRRIADSITAMPIEKSNIPKDQIPEYVKMFEKFDFPVNLYKAKTNFVGGATTVLETAPQFKMRIRDRIRDLEYSMKNSGRNNYQDTVQDMKDAIDSLEPGMINIVTNLTTSSPLSQISEKWLAHDIFHAISDNIDMNEIVRAVNQDLEAASLNRLESQGVFFHWLPDEFKKDAPAYPRNLSVDDYMPDLMVHYLASGATLPRDIKIDYKPIWVTGRNVYRSKPDYDMGATEVRPKPDANAVQLAVRDMLQNMYREMHTSFENYIGKVFKIG